MADAAALALAALRSIRASAGLAGLADAERRALDRDLGQIQRALAPQETGRAQAHEPGRALSQENSRLGSRAPARALPWDAHDPYAQPLDESPIERDMRQREQQRFVGGGPLPASQRSTGQQPPAPTAPPEPTAPPPPPGTAQIGDRARRALEAVDFAAFVSGLVTGTFKSIVDATAQQMREYAQLVASISRSVDDFASENVSPNQVRDWFVQRYPNDLKLQLPEPGKAGQPKLLPKEDGAPGPKWLARYGLAGRDLTEELTDGELLEKGRNALGEERMQTLASLVLMGVSRIVVDNGQIKAKLQFHAAAREQVRADIGVQTGIGNIAQSSLAPSNVSTMVSTLGVNAQADASIKADLMGEVSIQFRTETFPLERFADSRAIELINSNARWQAPVAAPAAAAPGAAPAVAVPSPAAPRPAGGPPQ